MNFKNAADKVFKLSIKAERTSMLLHWPLYWISRALYATARLRASQASKRLEIERARRSTRK